MRHVGAFLHKTLTSRKFWAAVAASIPFAQAGDWNSFAMVWMAYAGIQGAVDGLEAHGAKRAATDAHAWERAVTASKEPPRPSLVDTKDGGEE